MDQFWRLKKRFSSTQKLFPDREKNACLKTSSNIFFRGSLFVAVFIQKSWSFCTIPFFATYFSTCTKHWLQECLRNIPSKEPPKQQINLPHGNLLQVPLWGTWRSFFLFEPNHPRIPGIQGVGTKDVTIVIFQVGGPVIVLHLFRGQFSTYKSPLIAPLVGLIMHHEPCKVGPKTTFFLGL